MQSSVDIFELLNWLRVAFDSRDCVGGADQKPHCCVASLNQANKSNRTSTSLPHPSPSSLSFSIVPRAEPLNGKQRGLASIRIKDSPTVNTTFSREI